MANATEQRVESILRRMARLDDARELLAELNYDPANDPIPRHGWGEAARDALAEDPRIIAAHGDFQVIYCRLPGPKLLRTPERAAVNKLLQNHPYALFVFSNQDQSLWHFLNVKYDERVERRRLFRRITVGASERLRTATERLGRLDLENIQPGLPRIPPLAIQSAHDDAFDVEPVTREFYRKYRQVFEGVEPSIRGIREPERRRLFTQRLFNRLMFLAFVQKKGWLSFRGRTDYLDALWESWASGRGADGGFYRDRLKLLFFEGLNVPRDLKGPRMRELIGDVPYLNGGLFEQEADDRDPAIVVPDGCIRAILEDLFAPFNFTITESTPLDIEVAVDPEMLGKVFEELVTGRHETGSYYTPKPVVAFMCREALKGYLRESVPGEAPEVVEAFVERHEAERLRHPEAILDALRRVRVCDPACGSGAYLLGMLHELLDLRTGLFAARSLDPLNVYGRKLEIIENNVYGVDIDPFAVNIARLRLWLSLAVDYEGADPPPLPNLDFKIECGDSLLAPNPQDMGVLRHRLIPQLRDAKADYLRAHGEKKERLRGKVDKLKAELAAWAHAQGPVKGFDWAVEFAEVFAEGGFDIVLANPPYVRADAQFRHIADEWARQAAIAEWKEYRKNLKASGIYKTLYEKWDLYIPFLERAHQLIRPRGRMVFIISDAYNAAKYARKSHEFFLSKARIERIDFCSDIPLFEAGVSNTILHIARATPAAEHRPVRVGRSGDAPDDFGNSLVELSSRSQRLLGSQLFQPATRGAATSGAFVELGKIVYISYGLRPNADDRYWRGEFDTKDCLSPVRDRIHPQRFLQGRDIERWHIRNTQFLEWGTSRAPKKFARPTFVEMYEVPEKLIAVKVSPTQKVAYDSLQHLHSDGAICLTPWHYLTGVINRSIDKTCRYRAQDSDGDREDREALSRTFCVKYLLAVLNSRVTWQRLAERRRNRLQLYPDDWKGLPIVPLPMEKQQEFVELVDAILGEFRRHGYPLPAEAAARVAALERELDDRVAALYGVAAPGDAGR